MKRPIVRPTQAGSHYSGVFEKRGVDNRGRSTWVGYVTSIDGIVGIQVYDNWNPPDRPRFWFELKYVLPSDGRVYRQVQERDSITERGLIRLARAFASDVRHGRLL